ncbi:baseplate J/gp47 family protein [Amaricoccus tamworthensis]|uniref:baseplate J/gp47 family protein n=1 Tax=Amaricoccus tamworthensis TaxID=57002 RepID=UPI003C7CF000
MAEILNDEELRDRARDLNGFNGFDLVFVDLKSDLPNAVLTAEFLNEVGIAEILAEFAGGLAAHRIFDISGGHRRRGGVEPGEVQVHDIQAAGPRSLELTVAPVGDYSTYRLTALRGDFDPVFAGIDFKFRPGCFNLDCRRAKKPVPEPGEVPVIDYLARDYHSFKHMLINAMAERVPGWQPTSEADLDMVIINLLAARGDEIADKQDRVVNEAYFPRARKRLSLTRHARLMDYHVHQGNQASSWAALEVSQEVELPAHFTCWTGRSTRGEVFVHEPVDPEEATVLHPELNALELYTWGNLVGALEDGSTEADLTQPGAEMTQAQAEDLRDLLMGMDRPLLIEEALNPETGRPAGRDMRQRRMLRLTDAVVRPDPAEGVWMVRVTWRGEDALPERFCFVTRCPGEGPVGGVSLFHGNTVPVVHGFPNLTLFNDPERAMDAALAAELDLVRDGFRAAFPFGRISETTYATTPWGRLCVLPEGPLAWRDTPPGGEVPPRSTLQVDVEGMPGWHEQTDLVQSRGESADFIVEADELGRSAIRFGNGINGAAPPPGTFVAAWYLTGTGPDGNVGADAISGFDSGMFPGVTRVWNPFDLTNGRLPETPEVIRRRAPEAYRSRQLRAVTLNDYRRRAEELPFVQRAAAAHAWTGSWRTVVVTLDPVGGFELGAEEIAEASAHLNSVRLIGEDLEIRPPDFVSLDILLEVCAKPRFWREDLRFDLEEAFSETWTGSGGRGFFHPDLWSFGQSLYASAIIGRALEVEGVDRVTRVGMRPWDQAGGPSESVVVVEPQDLPIPEAQKIEVGPNQIIRVANDPNALELGRMTIVVKGGRR